MEWFEIIIIIGAVLFVGLVTFLEVRKKLRGQNSCGGSCSGCKAGQNECPACQIKEDLKHYIETK